ncbi:MAG: tRNA (guanosine(46)-N7)-methyltransferase TrmB [Planctomycetota bacterium]
MRTSSPQKVAHGDAGKWDVRGVMLPDEQLEGPLNFQEVFGNGLPVEIEVGPGKGTFLVARGHARPEINLLGVEYAKPFCAYAADRIRRHGLTNVRTAATDALPFFRQCLPDRSIWRVHVYFPDPWPKRRHHKRRLIQPPFLREVCRVLQPGGQLLIVTDHMGYFRHIRRVLHDWPGLAEIPMPEMSDAEGELVGTNFERKYIAQGRNFYNLARLRYD